MEPPPHSRGRDEVDLALVKCEPMDPTSQYDDTQIDISKTSHHSGTNYCQTAEPPIDEKPAGVVKTPSTVNNSPTSLQTQQEVSPAAGQGTGGFNFDDDDYLEADSEYVHVTSFNQSQFTMSRSLTTPLKQSTNQQPSLVDNYKQAIPSTGKQRNIGTARRNRTGIDEESNQRDVMTTDPSVEYDSEKMILALQKYSMTGDVTHLLSLNSNLIAVPDINGDNNLHLSIINKKSDTAMTLLQIILNLPDGKNIINDVNIKSQTALHLAVLTRETGLVLALMSAGCDPTIVDYNGNTPLHIASQHGDQQCLYAMLDFNNTTQHNLINQYNNNGLAALHLAVISGSEACVVLLIRAKANVNVSDHKNGKTPLHYATEKDNINIMNLLIETCANYDYKTFAGDTCLGIAKCKKLSRAENILTTSGALYTGDFVSSSDSDCSHIEAEERSGQPVVTTDSSDRKVSNINIWGSSNRHNDDHILFNTQLSPPLITPHSPPTPHTDTPHGVNLDELTMSTVTMLLVGLETPNPGQPGWMVLAEAFKQYHKIHECASHISPAQCLMEILKSFSVTVDLLTVRLKQIERHDLANIIEQQFSHQNRTTHLSTTTRTLPDSPYKVYGDTTGERDVHDSGVIELGCSVPLQPSCTLDNVPSKEDNQ